MPTRSELAQEALRTSIKFRKIAGLALDVPANPFDLADALGVVVRLVDVNMEGMYVGGAAPTIIVSCLRPLGRRFFTCAHEIGHHAFGHGATIDQLKSEGSSTTFNPSEFLADTFAGFILMPPPGIRRAFMARQCSPSEARPLLIARIASAFGVGYDTMVTQLKAQRSISASHAADLERVGIAGVKRELLGSRFAGQLHCLDAICESSVIDVEVGDRLFLPPCSRAVGNLTELRAVHEGNIYEARTCGIHQVQLGESKWIFVRASPPKYVGLATYRHLEGNED